ncbi:hexokinase [Trifolium repens]|nr:hexokinase [Trifolium repens]
MQVLTRYLLQKLFGPEVTNMTNNHTILYLDLPSTMIVTTKFKLFTEVRRHVVSCLNEAKERQGLDMRVSSLVNPKRLW